MRSATSDRGIDLTDGSLAQTCGLWYNGETETGRWEGLMLYLKLNGYEISCEMGIRWLDALELLLPVLKYIENVLGMIVINRTKMCIMDIGALKQVPLQRY